jgi:hypothetical protein
MAFSAAKLICSVTLSKALGYPVRTWFDPPPCHERRELSRPIHDRRKKRRATLILPTLLAPLTPRTPLI